MNKETTETNTIIEKIEKGYSKDENFKILKIVDVDIDKWFFIEKEDGKKEWKKDLPNPKNIPTLNQEIKLKQESTFKTKQTELKDIYQKKLLGKGDLLKKKAKELPSTCRYLDRKIKKSEYKIINLRNSLKDSQTSKKTLDGFYLNPPKTDYKLAFKYFQKSNQKDSTVNIYLGKCFEKGLGVKQSHLQAIKHYELAGLKPSTKIYLEAYIYDFKNLTYYQKNYQFLNIIRNHPAKETFEILIEKKASLDVFFQIAKSYIKYKKLFGLEILKYASEKGHQNSTMELAQIYTYNRIGIPPDINKAMEYYTKLANLNHSEAQTQLAKIYDIKFDFETSFKYTKLAYENSPNESNLLKLVKKYQKGIGCKKDLNEAFRLLNIGKDNESDRIYKLGKYYENGWSVKKDLAKAAELYEKSGARTKGFHKLAIWYEMGYFFEKNEEKALEYYSKLGDVGSYLQGMFYFERKDYEKAISFFERNCYTNRGDCLERIGYCYEHGLGVEKDYKKAFEYYEKAGLFHSTALNQVGYFYFNGIGVEKNLANAYSSFKKASRLDDPFSFNNLGVCFEKGYGVKIDLKNAKNNYILSAEKGNKYGQYNLGIYYLEHENNKKEALKYLKMAADQGEEDAIIELENLLKIIQ